MSFVPYDVNYAGRLIDVELLQTIEQPVSEKRVYVATVSGPTKIVTGIEKAIQRYANLLLTTLGDVHFDPEVGNTLLRAVGAGLVNNTGMLYHLFALANVNVLSMMHKDDTDTRYGPTHDDELIVSGQLTDVDIDYDQRIITLSVLLTTAAGDVFTYIVPVSIAR